MQYKTSKVSELIKALQSIQEDYGNLPVVIASDAELNSVGTINAANPEEMLMEDNGILVLYPNQSDLYLDDIKGYAQPNYTDYEEEEDEDEDDKDLFDDYDEDE